ncbi:AMP-binding protein [Rhodoferax sp.]|uniref:AMP-binding protein n=1 Tax=Rhodoferax sp. TaxID=50421 RepID=UPI001EBAC75F|nr:AMP-binding protein [Rhodoferax sp.]MBT9506698.1 AMP-binding protein [Rhodoferax sp.]
MQNRIWHRSYPPGMPREITLDSQQTIASMIAQSCLRHAERIAASCQGEQLRYADLDRLSVAFGVYLQSVGLQKGERIALMLPNCLPYLVALSGALRAGMVVVNVNPLYTARELEHQLADSGATCIVVATPFLSTVQKVLSGTRIRQLVTTPLGDLQATVALRMAEKQSAAVLPDEVLLSDAIAKHMGRSLAPLDIQASDTAFLQYTGGTTGVSKGAVLTHHSVGASLAQMQAWAGFALEKPGASVVTPLPLYHIYPLAITLVSIALGSENRLIPNPRDSASVIAEMRRQPFELFIGVNTLFNALVENPDLQQVDFSRTQLVTGAGASVQGAVATRWLAAGGAPITEGYGLTETSPSATFNPPGRNGTIGIPVPSTDVLVVDNDGHPVERGQPGELLLKGPQLFAGYWNRDEETRNAFTPDGWFKTGDVVTMDDAGFLYIVDRKKDMILVSGFNVYPNEIEAVVALLADVLECACVGVPDARSGEAPHLFAVPRHASVTPEHIEAHCRANLAAYKVPRHITLVDALPKSAIGKILRKELRGQ